MKTLDRRYLGTYILHGWYVKFHIPPCTINATKMYIIKIKTVNLIFALSLLQSRTKLLEKVFPIMSAFLRNKTISKTTPLRKDIPFPQFNVASFKCPGIRLSFEYTTTLLSGEGGVGRTGTATMLRKMLL